MSMTDPIASGLTQIRNALRNHNNDVMVAGSCLMRGVLETLQREGFIASFETLPGKGTQQRFKVQLKYGPNGEEVIRSIRRVSKPGIRTYATTAELVQVVQGHGISVVSTSKGVLSDRECRSKKLGGEVLCTVW